MYWCCMQAVCTDADWFQLAEAEFQVTLLMLHTKNTLEAAAFEMLEPPRGAQTNSGAMCSFLGQSVVYKHVVNANA